MEKFEITVPGPDELFNFQVVNVCTLNSLGVLCKEFFFNSQFIEIQSLPASFRIQLNKMMN
jgi:hypothetical protein